MNFTDFMIQMLTLCLPFTDTPLDCEVSAWSPWGLCKGQCGEDKKKGMRYRTRYIHIKPANNGSACPPLEEERTCVPDNCE